MYTDEAHSLTPHEYQESKAVANRRPRLENSSEDLNDGSGYFCGSTQLSREKHLAQLQLRIANGSTNNLQSSNLLLSVTQFNIMRAMFANAATMGLSIEILSEDIASQFNIAGPMTLQLPPSLQPNSSQKRIIHHPWIDLLPIESLRNSLLSKMDTYDEDELCIDLYGLCDMAPEVGLLVWGESWDPSAYEISEGVFKKWSWLLRDCADLMRSTNYWRRKRGERPLRLESGHNRIEKVQE